MLNEIICNLDQTLAIWRDAKGYYWFDQFDRQRGSYFATEKQAIDDCKDLVYKE